MTHPNAEVLERAFGAFGRDPIIVARSLAGQVQRRVAPAERIGCRVWGRADLMLRGADRKPEDAGSETAAGRKPGQTCFRCAVMMDLHL